MDVERDSLPFDSESVDVVIANQVLEHIKEIFWVFHECSRVLRNNGYMIVGVPNLASFHNRVMLFFGRQPSPIKIHSAHVRGFTKHGFNKFLENTWPEGYELKSFAGSNYYPFPPVLAKPLAKLFPGSSAGSFFLLQKRRPYYDSFLKYPAVEELETNFYLGD